MVYHRDDGPGEHAGVVYGKRRICGLGFNDHGAVLIGYGPDTVTIADPISGLVEYSREQFESVFASRSYKCVIIQEEVV